MSAGSDPVLRAGMLVLGTGVVMLLAAFAFGSASGSASDNGTELTLAFTALFLGLGGVPAGVAGLLGVLLRRRPAAATVPNVLGGIVVLLSLPWSLMMLGDGSAWSLVGVLAGVAVGAVLITASSRAYASTTRRR